METTRAGIAIYKINYQSDFILTVVCDVEWGTPFCIKFWTGEPAQAYYVGWDGNEYRNCKVVESDPSKLLVLFDDHHLPVGELKMQIAYHTTIEDFPNAIVDEVTNSMKVMAYIDGKNQKIALDFEGEEDAELQFELPAYANEAQRIANEEQRIANEQARIEAEQQRIDNEQTRQNNEAQRIAQESARVNEYAGLKADAVAATDAANDAATLANQKAQLAADKAALADAAATLANQKAQLAADKAALADAAATLANQKAEYADAKGDYAKEQGDYAKEQGDTALADHRRAESDHETAVSDHTIAANDHTQAGNDHTRAESDHSTAADDHTLAASDHSTAAADHTLAASDHSTAAADHTLAASDHSTAANDHTQAGNDHTRAESDHTRAESDHAAVEVYVDSLGAFDISSYHATGGVLAKYADLTAALGTGGANIPEAIRKGGMSVKFVHTSDNKYVQYRLMNNQWSTTESDWQGVDAKPTKRSHNLVESGGVAKVMEAIIDDELPDIVIADGNGNVAMSVSEDGLKVRNLIFSDKNGNKVSELNGKTIIDSEDGKFYFVDKYGNIVFCIDSNGINAGGIGENLSEIIRSLAGAINFSELEDVDVNTIPINKSLLQGSPVTYSAPNALMTYKNEELVYCGHRNMIGKKVLVIGDSLANRPAFADYFREMTACETFFASRGGTTNFPYNGSMTNNGTKISGQDRLLAAFRNKLIDAYNPDNFTTQEYDYDYVFIENVNDLLCNYYLDNGLGTLNDAPFMVSQYVNISKAVSGADNAKAAVEDDFTNISNSAWSSLCTIGEIKVTQKANTSGNIIITINGSSENVAITTSMNLYDVCKAIRDVINENIEGYKAIASGTRCFITALDAQSNAIPTVNAESTGLQCTCGKYCKGTIIDCSFISNKYEIQIRNSATANGIITVTIGSSSYPTSVQAGDTPSNIASAIGLTSFGSSGFSCSVSGSTIVLTRVDSGTDIPTISAGTTGCNCTVNTSTENAHVFYYFYGGDETGFKDIENWSWTPPSLAATYKGMIEFLQITMPKCRIVCTFPTAYQTQFYTANSNHTDEWGYLSWDKLRNNQWYFNKMFPLVSLVRSVAEYYFVDFVDMFEKSGVTLLNQASYYPEDGGVHPLQSMYKRWAEVINDCLK